MTESSVGPTRVSNLELFFDLVFVFTITQLTSVLETRPTLRGLLQVTLMLGAIWWMHGGYAWLTNTVAADRLSRRLLLLGAWRATSCRARDPARLLGQRHRVRRCLPRRRPCPRRAVHEVVLPEHGAGHPRTRAVQPRHRAVGMGVRELPVDLELVAVVVAGLALSACLWWTYLGGDDERAERALRETPPEQRFPRAINAFGYCHFLLLLGIVAVAAAVHEATGHAFHELGAARSLTLAGGVAVYLVGHVLFRASLGIGRSSWRLACAAAVLLTIPLGTSVAAEAQIVALVALLVACFALERRAS